MYPYPQTYLLEELKAKTLNNYILKMQDLKIISKPL